MSELEMEIARKFGASAFLLYQFVKHNPNSTYADMETETGLSWSCIQQTVPKLRESNILNFKTVINQRRLKSYKVNDSQETWYLH